MSRRADPSTEVFVCPVGGAVSRNPGDVLNRYCRRCRVYVEDVLLAAEYLGGCGDLLSADAPCTVEEVQRALREAKALTASFESPRNEREGKLATQWWLRFTSTRVGQADGRGGDDGS